MLAAGGKTYSQRSRKDVGQGVTASEIKIVKRRGRLDVTWIKWDGMGMKSNVRGDMRPLGREPRRRGRRAGETWPAGAGSCRECTRATQGPHRDHTGRTNAGTALQQKTRPLHMWPICSGVLTLSCVVHAGIREGPEGPEDQEGHGVRMYKQRVQSVWSGGQFGSAAAIVLLRT